MSELSANQFFDLEGLAHRDLFAADEPVWSALGDRLCAYLESWSRWAIEVELHPGVHLLGDCIAIGPGCRIEPGAVIVGPAILEGGVTVRTGAYVREHVVLCAGSLVGAHSEVKGAVLGDGCKTGCNTVLNPGVLLGPGSVTYPNATLRGGFYPAGTLVKVRQSQQLVEMSRLRPR